MRLGRKKKTLYCETDGSPLASGHAPGIEVRTYTWNIRTPSGMSPKDNYLESGRCDLTSSGPLQESLTAILAAQVPKGLESL